MAHLDSHQMNVCSRDVVMLPLLFQQVVETSLVDQDYQHTVKKISAHMITTQIMSITK
jgi:hypothetical protein